MASSKINVGTAVRVIMYLLRSACTIGIVSFFWVMCLTIEGLASNIEKICPRQEKIDAYQHRNGNRCEGIRISKIARSHADIVSVTLKPLLDKRQTLPDTLILKVYERTDNFDKSRSDYHKVKKVVVRDFKENYWLDNFIPQAKDSFLTFQWPTKVLRLIKIKLSQLHGSAQDAYEIFSPVIIVPPSYSGALSYEFGVFDEKKRLKLITFQIFDEKGNRLENVNFEHAFASEEKQNFIYVKWDGMQNGRPLQPGIYSIRFQVETIDDKLGITSAPSRTYNFLHDPDLLRQK